jgi:hypothetical protein
MYSHFNRFSYNNHAKWNYGTIYFARLHLSRYINPFINEGIWHIVFH